MEKARDVVKESIAELSERCAKLQMLKFGQVLDIDQLEAGNDRSKEMEAQEGVKQVEEKFEHEKSHLQKEYEEAKRTLAEVRISPSVLPVRPLLTGVLCRRRSKTRSCSVRLSS